MHYSFKNTLEDWVVLTHISQRLLAFRNVGYCPNVLMEWERNVGVEMLINENLEKSAIKQDLLLFRSNSMTQEETVTTQEDS